MTTFCEESNSLLRENFSGGKLSFVSAEGIVYVGTAKDSLLSSQNMDTTASKYDNAISNAAFNPVSSVVKYECSACSRKLVRFIQVGENKQTIYKCYCGNMWG